MFHVGQLVVCVKREDGQLRWPVRAPLPDERLPVIGTIYTIRDSFRDEYGDASVRLVEIINPIKAYSRPGLANSAFEAYWLAAGFRPVDETRLSIFRKMLAPAPRKEEVA